MNSDTIADLLAQFEAIARNEGEVEFWLARELQPLLGYERWENFTTLLDRARTACGKAGQAVDDHFREVTKMVSLGSGARRAVEDVALTRYAAYLLAQNGDPRKEAIAFAQTYFAVQTRRSNCRSRLHGSVSAVRTNGMSSDRALRRARTLIVIAHP